MVARARGIGTGRDERPLGCFADLFARLLAHAVTVRLRQHALADELALVGIGEPGLQFGERYPGDLGDFDVLVGELAAGGFHQEVVHGLVYTPLLGHEPVVDGAQWAQYLRGDAGLLLHLAHGRLFHRLTVLDVTFRQ